MNKQEFLDKLQKALSGMPSQEVDEHLTFYSEMIDDLMEEGLSPEEAVQRIGSVDAIAAQIKADMPLKSIIMKEAKRNYSLPLWAIVLLIIGAPVWGSILIGILSVVFALVVIIVSAVIGLWAVSISVGACAVAGLVTGILQFAAGNTIQGICLLGAAFICAGLTILLVMASIFTGKAIAWSCKKIVNMIKKQLVRKGDAQ